MMVFSLCAIVKMVQSENSRLIVFCISLSVSKSTAAVASSKTKTLVFLNSARARHTNCLCPTLKFNIQKESRCPISVYIESHRIITNLKPTLTLYCHHLLYIHVEDHLLKTLHISWDGNVPKLSTLPYQCSSQMDQDSFVLCRRIKWDPNIYKI